MARYEVLLKVTVDADYRTIRKLVGTQVERQAKLMVHHNAFIAREAKVLDVVDVTPVYGDKSGRLCNKIGCENYYPASSDKCARCVWNVVEGDGTTNLAKDNYKGGDK